MKILLIKLSSLGDVLHNIPIVWDLRRSYPEAEIDWVTEETYIDLLAPLLSNDDYRGIDQIIPINLRQWKKNIKSLSQIKKTIKEFKAFKKLLQEKKYDLIIDTQGLIKSAIVGFLARKTKKGLFLGLGNKTKNSSYEGLSKIFYTTPIPTPFRCRAVDRSRYLAAAATKTEINSFPPPSFYPNVFLKKLTQNLLPPNYILCFHATARDEKRWPNENWIQLGQALAKEGYILVFPWGNLKEKATSDLLTAQIPQAIVPEKFSLTTAFGLITNAKLIIGVDTGLTHVSAALNAPTIEIYCATLRWRYEGYWSPKIKNLGDKDNSPSVETVLEAAEFLLKKYF